MKRFLIILSILFTVLLTIFACKKVNLLAPTYIPEETKLSSQAIRKKKIKGIMTNFTGIFLPL